MNTCAIIEQECKGVCPEIRIERNQKNVCPALYWKDPNEKKENLYFDDEMREE